MEAEGTGWYSEPMQAENDPALYPAGLEVQGLPDLTCINVLPNDGKYIICRGKEMTGKIYCVMGKSSSGRQYLTTGLCNRGSLHFYALYRIPPGLAESGTDAENSLDLTKPTLLCRSRGQNKRIQIRDWVTDKPDSQIASIPSSLRYSNFSVIPDAVSPFESIKLRRINLIYNCFLPRWLKAMFFYFSLIIRLGIITADNIAATPLRVLR